MKCIIPTSPSRSAAHWWITPFLCCADFCKLFLFGLKQVQVRNQVVLCDFTENFVMVWIFSVCVSPPHLPHAPLVLHWWPICPGWAGSLKINVNNKNKFHLVVYTFFFISRKMARWKCILMWENVDMVLMTLSNCH